MVFKFEANSGYTTPIREILQDEFDRDSVDAVVDDSLSRSRVGELEPDTNQFDAIRTRKYELENLPKAEFDDLLNNARMREYIRIEAAHWFNAPQFQADFEYWVRMPYWSIEEGLVVISGRDPRHVKLTAMNAIMKESSRFGKWLVSQVELANRFVACGTLQKNNAPKVFVTWARESGLDIAEGLKLAFDRQGLAIIEKTKIIETQQKQINGLSELIDGYKKLAEKKDSDLDELAEALATSNQIAETFLSKNANLKEEMAAQSEVVVGKQPDPRILRSLYKIIIAVVMDVYGYSPESGRSHTTKDIQEALAKVGLELSDDTIRSVLKASTEYLPNEAQS